MRTAIGIIVLAGMACGANATASEIPKRECKELVKTYFRQSNEVQREMFASAGIEKQYAIYICGNQYMHPSWLKLADYFADVGPAAADYLHEKLKRTTDDLTVRDITRAFEIMKRRGTYNARQDSGLMHLLEEKIAAMKRPDWKAVVEDMYREIARES